MSVQGPATSASGTAVTQEGLFPCPVCSERNRRSNRHCFSCGWLLQGTVIGADPGELQTRLEAARADWLKRHPPAPPPKKWEIGRRLGLALFSGRRLLQALPYLFGAALMVLVVVGIGLVVFVAGSSIAQTVASYNWDSPAGALARTVVGFIPGSLVLLALLGTFGRAAFSGFSVLMFITKGSLMPFLFVFLPSVTNDLVFEDGSATRSAYRRLMDGYDLSVLTHKAGEVKPVPSEPFQFDGDPLKLFDHNAPVVPLTPLRPSGGSLGGDSTFQRLLSKPPVPPGTSGSLHIIPLSPSRPLSDLISPPAAPQKPVSSEPAQSSHNPLDMSDPHSRFVPLTPILPSGTSLDEEVPSLEKMLSNQPVPPSTSGLLPFIPVRPSRPLSELISPPAAPQK